MIEIQNLCKDYGEESAVDKLNLSIQPGEIFGFLGPNGAGKTTTVKLLTGMILPTSGTARVAGFDILEQPIEVKKRIGYVPESGALFESLTAWEYLELVAELHHLDAAVAQNRIEEFLSLFEIDTARDQRLQEYSKGMKQKVLLSAALIHNPQVLFLDEPLNGLDANSAMVVKEILRNFSAQNKTIMFCSHILEVVERICTRIAIIDRGKIITVGTAEEIMRKSSQGSLESAFNDLTGSHNIKESTHELLKALERA